MASRIVVLTMGHPSGLDDGTGAITDLDLYRLHGSDLDDVTAIFVGAAADQVHLERHRDRVDGFVRRGGRLVVCGHVVRPFGAGLTPFTPFPRYGLAELTVHRRVEHPVWAGVDCADLTYRRGVAGFYGRGGYLDLPVTAQVVHVLGPEAWPLDAVHPWGDGEVLVHGGNDLWGYSNDETTAARMAPQLVAWARR